MLAIQVGVPLVTVLRRIIRDYSPDIAGNIHLATVEISRN